MSKKKEISIDDLVGNKSTELKEPKQKENTVKISNTKKTATISVISTLLIIATIVGIFYGGMKFEQNRQHQIKVQATELAAELKPQK